MGKTKVSFTTVLFVFSFIICVIVAVVFVDRGPRNDYDSFYESADESTDRNSRDINDARSGVNQNNQQASAPAPTSPPAAPTPDESSFADLPLDAHLKAAAQPVQFTATPAPTANPMQGRSPEEIARSMMGQSGISPAQFAASVPQMAVPPGIATPAMQQGQMVQQTPQQTRTVLPLQSNDPTNSMGGGYTGSGIGGGANTPGLYGLPSLGTGSTNVAEGWSAVSAKQTPDRMLGVRSAPSDAQNGMMISRGATEAGADAPAGFEQSITSHTPATGVSAPGGFEEPMLLQAPGQTPNKWDLPAAPTLRPPPIQDPDRPRSDADPVTNDLPTPGSMDIEGSSGQALAISAIAPDADQGENDGGETDEPDHVAKVNNRTLTADQALKLAEVAHAMKDSILTEDKRDEEAKKAAETWADIVASAEMARANGIDVAAPDVEKYAGMRPDFDPAAWQAAMADKGFAPQDIRQLLRDVALSEKLVEMEFEQATNDEDIRKAYDKKPSQYASPRKVRLLEIYKDKPDDDDRAEKVASSMRRLQRQASSGTDFGLLARQASQSGTRLKGGDLGWITPSESKDELRDKAIADLEPGQVSDVIDEPDGYRIYKLVDVQEAKNDFEGGRELVIAELKKPVRTQSLKEAREKLEAGEPLVLDRIVTAKAKVDKPVPAKPEPEDATKTTGNSDIPASDELTPEETERRAIARQVLADARARQNGETPGQQVTATAPGPISVPQQPGTANQLLYAPGTQVQQMGGGQPAPPYQAGGQPPAPPVANAMAAPNSVSVNGNVSVSYAPGQTMHVGGNANLTPAAAAASPRYPNSSAAANYVTGNQAMEPAGETAYIDLGYSPENAGFTQAQQAQAQAQIMQAQQTRAPAPEVTQSNGWSVTKTVRDNGNGSEAAMTGNDAMESAATIPPGFGGAGGEATPSEEEPESRGIIGNVKSFFGGFRR